MDVRNMFVLLLTNCSFLVFLKTMFFQSQIRYYLHFLRMKVELSTFTFVELKMKFKKKKKNSNKKYPTRFCNGIQ